MVDLTDLALARGTLGIFSRLVRAYSVGTNATGDLVIAGIGLDTNSPANTRAFLVTAGLSNAPVLFPPKVTISAPCPAEFMFSFLTFPGSNVMYYLEYTTNLAPPIAWTTIAATPGSGTMANLYDLNSSGQQRLYRIRVQ